MRDLDSVKMAIKRRKRNAVKPQQKKTRRSERRLNTKTKEREREREREREKMGRWAIAVHGGAGVDPNLPPERQDQAKQLLTRCLNLGVSALRSSSSSAIDVVELIVRIIPRLSVVTSLSSFASILRLHFRIFVRNKLFSKRFTIPKINLFLILYFNQ